MSLVQPQPKNKSAIDMFSFNTRTTLSITFISLLIACSLTVIFHFINEKYKATFICFSTTLGVGIVGTSALYAYSDIRLSIENQASDRKSSLEDQLTKRALDYIKLWNDPQYLNSNKTAIDIYHQLHSKPASQKAKFAINLLEQNPDKRQEITNALNFLNEIAICCQEKIVEEELIYNYYRTTMITYCDTFSTYIGQTRKEINDQDLYRPLTNLCEEWEKREK
ncbi:MAG: DUF4760 domain-containing protein [Pseudanabaenales cyanobacterium]|nr:DUF4760 domain-containing protein [Pseudanabaenales cyanobacterium]